jgi:surfeit locus 1 family protein
VKRLAFLVLCFALAATFASLGVWQLQRLQWKNALIERVETGLAAAPRAAPRASEWSNEDAYTRVEVSGVFLHEHETLVQAVTDLGPGWWVMTPLRTQDGVVLVNRGFVPSEKRAPASRQSGQLVGQVTVTGLLRASEPHGGFLRANAPEEGRWYSRDVGAIARASGLPEVLTAYFVDADAKPNPGGYPVGGLTVIRFRNDHLVYALTWFVLAILALAGAALLRRKN